jgi:hypothetical protein
MLLLHLVGSWRNSTSFGRLLSGFWETWGLSSSSPWQIPGRCAAVEIWYDSVPQEPIIIPKDEMFVESFFEIPDEEIEAKLHLQLLRLELNHANMIDHKLTMAYLTGRITESFKIDLFVIWSEDNSSRWWRF